MSTTKLDDATLSKLLAGAVSAAQQAGCIVLESVTKRQNGVADASGNIDTKSNAADFVTECDKKCDELIMASLKRVSPAGFCFLTEETCPDETVTDAPTWVVDPIDGTTSFMHGDFTCCISIALAVDRKPVLGVVFAPLLNELFTAISGKGAFRNGAPMLPRSGAQAPTKLSEALVGYHLPGKRTPVTLDTSLGIVRDFLEAGVHSVRCYGSAALDMVSVALGRMDLYVELGISAWDVAAGIVIVREAGGFVGDVGVGQEAPLMRTGKLGIVAAAGPELGLAGQEIAAKHGLTPETYLK